MKKNDVNRLFFCVFIFAHLLTSAQTNDMAKLKKQFSKGSFKQCHKLADKLILEQPTDPVPYLYKGYLTFLMNMNDKNENKTSAEVFKTAIQTLLKAKSMWTDDSSVYIPKEYILAFQKKMIRYINKPPKKFNSDELLTQYVQLFDNTSNAFINFYFEEVYYLLLEQPTHNIQTPLYIDKTISALQNPHLLIKRPLYHDMLANIYFKLLEQQKDSLAHHILVQMCQGFDNSSDQKRNYFINSISKHYSDEIWNQTKTSKESQAVLDKLAKEYPNLFPQINWPFDLTYFTPEWNNPMYSSANSAYQATYLTAEEKQVVYLMNLCRLNPALFNKTFLKNYLSAPPSTSYELSLEQTLNSMKAVGLLYPSQELFNSSEYHALDMGAHGGIGHNSSDRTTFGNRIVRFTTQLPAAENCYYGSNDPVEIVMQLLIDEGVSSLGHRHTILSPDYFYVGVAIRPHTKYPYNMVSDFTGMK